MKIKVSAIELIDATTKTGKPYQVVEVTYKNLSFEGKVESRKIMPFGTTADSAKVLKDATPGSVFEVTAVKNAAGYNDWTAVVPSEASESAPSVKGVSTSVASTPVVKSSYETAEERAKKQVYIVRQSSLTSAMTFLELTKAKNVDTQAVLSIAKEFENYVFGITTSPKAPVVPLADMEDDLPE